jgi:hypothetical protein
MLRATPQAVREGALSEASRWSEFQRASALPLDASLPLHSLPAAFSRRPSHTLWHPGLACSVAAFRFLAPLSSSMRLCRTCAWPLLNPHRAPPRMAPTRQQAGLRICCLAAAIGLNNSLQTLHLAGWTWGDLGNGTALPFLALGGGGGGGGGVGGGMLRRYEPQHRGLRAIFIALPRDLPRPLHPQYEALQMAALVHSGTMMRSTAPSGPTTALSCTLERPHEGHMTTAGPPGSNPLTSRSAPAEPRP